MINAAIAGATGLVGSALVERLAENSDFEKVIAVTRRPVDLSDTGTVNKVIDFSDLPDIEPLNDIQVAFCCLGTTMKKAGSKEAFKKVDYEYAVNFCKWAFRSGIRRMVLVSSLGADPGSSNFYLKTKGETEEAVKAVGFDKLIILRPSLLYGDREEFRLGERAGYYFLRLLSPFLFGKMRNFVPVHARQVAAAAVQYVLSEDCITCIVQPVQIQRFLK